VPFAELMNFYIFAKFRFLLYTLV